MIGVAAKQSEKEIVSEFFELFKTPWEFFSPDKTYDVVINTSGTVEKTEAKLTLIYNTTQLTFDIENHIITRPATANKYLQYNHQVFPIYGNLSIIAGHANPFLLIQNTTSHAGLEFVEGNRQIVRIGYDLFQEVPFLLQNGQPPQNASVPTLEVHADILRKLIIRAGIGFVEIPPVPDGYNFTVCLTHDIDFIRIRDHKFDHTMFGFLYRATIVTLLDVIRRKRTWRELYQNWKATLKLPLVYLGIAGDFWFKFDRYMELENNVDAKSTFFMIPYKNRAGQKLDGKDAYRRATKYDVTDIKETVKKLIANGFEVGTHGLDAWHDPTAARAEKNRITEVSGKSNIGIRMHWLCFNKDTYRVLEEAGFIYDATFGYNDVVGYRAGTSQIYKPPGVKRLFELPLNIQDTALFNPKHMSLSKTDAWLLAEDLIGKVSVFGGILTVLWHDRSLSPERLYDDFYIKLLAELKKRKVWFATAGEACHWFQCRRSVIFEKVEANNRRISVKSRMSQPDAQTHLKLRIYHPSPLKKQTISCHPIQEGYTEVAWQSEIDFSFS